MNVLVYVFRLDTCAQFARIACSEFFRERWIVLGWDRKYLFACFEVMENL